MSGAVKLDPEAIAIPLGRAALCLDCLVLYPIERQACPTCGSEGGVLVSRFLDRAEAAR